MHYVVSDHVLDLSKADSQLPYQSYMNCCSPTQINTVYAGCKKQTQNFNKNMLGKQSAELSALFMQAQQEKQSLNAADCFDSTMTVPSHAVQC